MRRPLFVLLALLAVPAARAQVCWGGVCVVNYETPDQETTFEMRNLRPDTVAVTLWFEFISGMETSARAPLTEVLAPGARREVLTMRRTVPGVRGTYRFRFDWRPEPVTACTSVLACTWWERTADATTLRVVRKTEYPVALQLVQPYDADTLRMVLWHPGRADVLRLGPNTARPEIRVAILPHGPEAEARYDSARVYPLPFRGRLQAVQVPDVATAMPLADLSGRPLPTPPGIRPFSWDAPAGTPVFAVRPGVVVAVSGPRVDLSPPDTFRTGNRMVVTRREDAGTTITVLHPDATTAMYSGLGTVADGIAPGRRIETGQRMGTVAPGRNLILGLQRNLAGRSVALSPLFRTARGPRRLAPGERVASPD
jgi:hypothetical protein